MDSHALIRIVTTLPPRQRSSPLGHPAYYQIIETGQSLGILSNQALAWALLSPKQIPGISPKQVPNVGTSFPQTDNSVSTSFPETGLSLGRLISQNNNRCGHFIL